MFIPDSQTYRTRTLRSERQFEPYLTRPVVTYNDPFSGFFWLWLLDRSLNDRAQWAYHHRSDMDASRYQALMATDTNLEARVRQLEMQKTPVDPKYAPNGIDRDLMYSDQHVHRAYVTRPTTSGKASFWLILIPTAIGAAWFMIWLVFYKRWKVA